MRNLFCGALCALAFLLVSGVSNAQELDCTKFHKGIFLYRTDDLGTVRVVKKRNKQTETGIYKATGQKFKSVYKVIWINECTFHLIFVKGKGSVVPAGSAPMEFRIVETNMDSYLVQMLEFPDIPPLLIEVGN